MARTVDEHRRAELLDRIVDYVLKNGVADLSLRPLALAVDSSPRVLLYYFTSKEALIVEVLDIARQRQRRQFGALRDLAVSSSTEVCTQVWAIMSAAKSLAAFRLFFEVYALALQDPKRFPGFLKNAVGEWLAFLEEPALRDGASPEHARAFATVLLAGFRGFLLDLCATHDRPRVDRAVGLWLASLEGLQAGGS